MWLRNPKLLTLILCISICTAFLLKFENWVQKPSQQEKLQGSNDPEVPSQAYKEKETGASIPEKNDLVVKLNYPHVEYLKHIESANQGVLISQYRVSKALERCKWAHKPSKSVFEEQITYLTEMGISEATQIVSIERKLARECGPLYELLGDKDLLQLADAWRVSAAEGGNVFAMLNQHMFHSPATDSETLANLIPKALSEYAGDEDLFSEALFAALYFHSNHGTLNDDEAYNPPQETYRRGAERDSWEIVYCNHTKKCNIDRVFNRLDTHYLDYEISNRRARAEEIEQLLDENKHHALGF